jgi:hypothetical protein
MTRKTLLVAVADVAPDLPRIRNVCQPPSAATRGQEGS